MTEPWSIRAVKQRWTLFGHVLGQPETTTPQLAINHYYSLDYSRKRGGQVNTIAHAMAKDVKGSFPGEVRLTYREDLSVFRAEAGKRKVWRDGIVSSVEFAYREHLNEKLSKK